MRREIVVPLATRLVYDDARLGDAFGEIAAGLREDVDAHRSVRAYHEATALPKALATLLVSWDVVMEPSAERLSKLRPRFLAAAARAVADDVFRETS